MDDDDWGERSDRWAGVRSEAVDVQGVRVHLLRADPDPDAPRDAPAQLLVHPMGAGAWWWLDLLRPLTAYGPVIAIDLPGSGRTRPPSRRAARAEASAQFLGDFSAELGLERVVVHGHSSGGLVSVLFADLAPERVERLVLASPALPGDPDPPLQMFAWQTIGRVLLFAAPPLGRVLMRASLRFKAAAWQRWLDNPADPKLVEGFGRIGGNPARISPQIVALVAEEINQYRSLPWRVDGAVTGLASAVAAMTVQQGAARAAMDRITAPTLLLWGDQDRMIPRVLIDQIIARRPDWDLHVFETVGHLLPWEAPDAYVEVVRQWLAETSRTAAARTPPGPSHPGSAGRPGQ